MELIIISICVAAPLAFILYLIGKATGSQLDFRNWHGRLSLFLLFLFLVVVLSITPLWLICVLFIENEDLTDVILNVFFAVAILFFAPRVWKYTEEP